MWLAEKRSDVFENTPTKLPLASYAGNYEHEVYGKMTIALENKKLVARFEHHKGRYVTLEALGGDNFLATFNDPIYGVNDWVFKTENGKVKSATITVAEFVEFTPYEFYKK